MHVIIQKKCCFDLAVSKIRNIMLLLAEDFANDNHLCFVYQYQSSVTANPFSLLFANQHIIIEQLALCGKALSFLSHLSPLLCLYRYTVNLTVGVLYFHPLVKSNHGQQGIIKPYTTNISPRKKKWHLVLQINQRSQSKEDNAFRRGCGGLELVSLLCKQGFRNKSD